VVDHFTDTVASVGKRVAAAYWRRTRLRQFSRMLGMIDLLARSGLGDLLLPYEVVRRSSAMLCVGDRRFRYSGPMLIQRKAVLFEEGIIFDQAPWREVVSAQHRLWRHGIGLSGSAEILGLRSWALLDGRVYLADTSSLTRDFELARQNLRSEALEVAVARVEKEINAPGTPNSIAKYVQSIREKINEDRLVELWGSAAGHL
jgi:hypothetical protein